MTTGQDSRLRPTVSYDAEQSLRRAIWDFQLFMTFLKKKVIQSLRL